MSGNIHDTDVNKLRNEIYDLLTELDTINTVKDVLEKESYFTNKYEYTIRTSKTLYDLIIKSYKNINFDKKQFLININMMLSSIENIQRDKISQHDASINVGETLATQFIPQLKK